jgi:hypothetical protein
MLLAVLAFVTPILDGVQEIACPGIPGPLVVFGRQAEVLVSGKEGKFMQPVVASAVYGKGRVVAFGHGGFLSQEAASVGQTKRLLANAVRWAAGKGGVAGVHRAVGIETLLKEEGIASRRLSEMDLSTLDGLSVLIIDPNGEAPKSAEPIRRFVREGGGLVIAGLGWGWLQLNPGKTIREHPCNLIVEPMGIAWADGYLEKTSAQGFTATPGPESANALAALSSLGSVDDSQTGQTLTRAAATLGPGHSFVRSLADRLAKSPLIIPTEKAPLTLARIEPRLRFTLSSLSETRNAESPAAVEFPGIPPEASPIISRSIDIDLGKPRWQSTGLYALPGKLIRVTIQQPSVLLGLRLRIGAHSDSLWNLDEWKRAPEISISAPIVSSTSQFSNPFGGLIYVEVPQGLPHSAANVKIENAVEAPWYVQGKITDAQWKTLRNAPAPWAEIESSKIILTVPSSVVRGLDNPDDLMHYWDRVSDACADLAGITRERKSPERYVADVQISAGYMHAGYPIMTHLDAAPRMVDLAFLSDPVKAGDWGLFHEIGHNHQQPEWTFDGTGEVTNNLFTLYIIETVVGRVPGYEVRWDKQQLLDLFRKHRATGSNFEKWKSDPFLALAMYVQLQQAFGWQPFKKIFADYRLTHESDKPKSDAEKRDKWLIKFSRAVGKNLSPFFDAWGVPVTAGAKRTLDDLPVWDFPK